MITSIRIGLLVRVRAFAFGPAEEAAAPPTLNQWPPHAPPRRAVAVSPSCSSSRNNSASLTSRPGNGCGVDAPGLLLHQPPPLPFSQQNNDIYNFASPSPGLDLGCDYYDFAAAGGFDFGAAPDLLLAGADGLDGNWLAQGLLDPSLDLELELSADAILIPDMATQTQTQMTPPLGMSGQLLHLEDDLFSQETANILASTLEQPSSIPAPINPIQPASSSSTTTPATDSPSYAPTSSGFSTFALNLPSQQASPGSSSGSTKRKADNSSPEADANLKRQRNTLAARKYRQKRLDRIAELELALADVTSDRDDLRLKLVRREAEVDALREMLGRK
ncbi:hypothetical protein B0J13DRAFT_627253 [Dactylonectria estremocensis]|uniref:BZIP domain-containing protein n=1 Tax=Dactylonectria estremocensis TaxID=1079267 RepID=A0A9P9E285_9HYPO|nr:hypothetical protein B0J13DRAFT_627253 [Dactylonectria estremocensis]